nr:hypothetical transcript [Hymenolepis microstoma]
MIAEKSCENENSTSGLPVASGSRNNKILMDVPENLQCVYENLDGYMRIFFKLKESEGRLTEAELLQDSSTAGEAGNIANAEVCLTEGAWCPSNAREFAHRERIRIPMHVLKRQQDVEANYCSYL